MEEEWRERTESGGFKVGDTVKFKTGGPVMIVDHISSRGFIVCRWFHESKLEEVRFKPETLVHAEISSNSTMPAHPSDEK